jgi:TonB family protein
MQPSCNRRISLWALSLSVILLLLFVPHPGYAEDKDIESGVRHVSKSLAHAHVKTVVVVDLIETNGMTRLGTFLADRLSEQLTLSKNKFTIVRKNHRMSSNGVSKQSDSPLDIDALEGLKSLGEAAILGEVTTEQSSVVFSLDVIDVRSGKRIDNANVSIPRALLPKDLPAPVSGAQTPEVFLSGRDHIIAKCISCPDPIFPPEARRKGIQGTVLLSVLITPGGQADEITVIKVAGHGFDENAIEAVRQWRFKPGMKDGRPVPVRTPIEVSFRRF